MQPLKAIPIPNSESSIGCCEVGARSRIDSRRWPRARLCCAYSPAASGPRCANGSSIAETRETSASELLLTRPQKPHIPNAAQSAQDRHKSLPVPTFVSPRRSQLTLCNGEHFWLKKEPTGACVTEPNAGSRTDSGERGEFRPGGLAVAARQCMPALFRWRKN